MCGIVGVASKGAMTHQMKEFFQQLLYHDVVRGEHATGIAAVDTLTEEVAIHKRALPSYIYLLDNETHDLFDHKKNYNIYIGHNRHATSGDKTKDEYAHPFQHGHITGVHNGTIRDQTLLDDNKDFVVDSDNLFYHMSVNGLDDTIQKLNGAYALVWYDSDQKSLNFLRNDERPMAIAVLDNECIIWASEMGMLRWLVKRHRTLKFKKYKVKSDTGNDYEIEMAYQLEVGDHLRFNFNGRVAQDPISSKKKLPDFPSYTTTYYGGNYQRWNGRSNNYTHSSFDRGNLEAGAMLKKANASIQIKSVVGARFLRFTDGQGTGKKGAVFEFIGSASQFPVLLYNGGWDPVVSDLTDDDIGHVFYGEITSGYVPTNFSPDDAINEYRNDKFIFSFGQIDRKSPGGKAYFPFSKTKAADFDDFRAILEAKKEGEDQRKSALLLPKHKEGSKSEPKEENSGKGNVLLKEVNSLSNTGVKIQLANAKITRFDMLDIVKENNYRCGGCAKMLSSVPVRDMWLIKGRDHADGSICQHLACGKGCYREIYNWIVDECKDEVIGNE